MHDLLQLMYQDGHLSSTELAALRRTSRQLKENPVRILRSLNVATPGEIKELLQRYYGFAAATDKVIDEIDDSLRAIIPADIALHYCVLPIADENGEVYVLMEDPTDKGVISQLQFFLDKRIVPVIATVQQLSSGLCRLYGVEPGRLKLSGLLEASRGAVGVSGSLNLGPAHFVDDSQPLLDDEVFKKLKAKPQKKAPKNSANPTPEVLAASKTHNSEELSTPAGTSTTQQPAALHIDDSNDSAKSSKSNTAPGLEISAAQVEPELVAALNVLGLRLSLARNRIEAVSMANERLSEFEVNLQIQPSGSILVVWKGASQEINIDNPNSASEAPQLLRGLMKKIAQCRPE